jgi:hypothetical protein
VYVLATNLPRDIVSITLDSAGKVDVMTALIRAPRHVYSMRFSNATAGVEQDAEVTAAIAQRNNRVEGFRVLWGGFVPKPFM